MAIEFTAEELKVIKELLEESILNGYTEKDDDPIVTAHQKITLGYE